MRIIHAPNPTGSGHNMRVLAIAQQLRLQVPDAEQIVLLGSMQDTFAPLFTAAGVKVIDLNPTATVDTSRHSHLSPVLDWDRMVGGYLAPAFVNGERVLRYLAHYLTLGADVVVSDYNPNASIAAGFAGLRHVFVTERFNFSLVNVSDEDLARDGATVRPEDLHTARTALDRLFAWILDHSALVLTDKPVRQDWPHDARMRGLLATGRAHFVGPMIRPIPPLDPAHDPRGPLGIDTGRLVVATVGGTTMRLENKKRLVSAYLEAFELLRRDRPGLQLALIGRGESSAVPGVHTFEYLPDWMPLIRSADVLLVPPGWITVTEICAMGIPAVFTLSSFSEYHEIEPFHRLRSFGFATNLGTDATTLAAQVAPFLDDPRAADRLRERYRIIAPHVDGARRAAALIGGLAPDPRPATAPALLVGTAGTAS